MASAMLGVVCARRAAGTFASSSYRSSVLLGSNVRVLDTSDVCGGTPVKYGDFGPCVTRRNWSLRCMSSRRNTAAETNASAPAAPAFGSPEEIRATSAMIFGNFNHIDAEGKQTNLRTGRKVLRRALAGPKLVGYYPLDPLRLDPFFEDPEEERYAICVIVRANLHSHLFDVTSSRLNE